MLVFISFPYLVVVCSSSSWSYSLPVLAAPAVPFVIPLLIFVAASWLSVPMLCPGSAIFGHFSHYSCRLMLFYFEGVMSSLSLYLAKGSSFLLSLPGPSFSNCLSCWFLLVAVVELEVAFFSFASCFVCRPFTLSLLPSYFFYNFLCDLYYCYYIIL